MGKTTVQLADEDDVSVHFDSAPSAAAIIKGRMPELSREVAAELVGYVGGEGIPMGGPAPPKP